MLNKIWRKTIVKPFQYNTRMWQTDGWSDRIATLISHISIAVLTHDKNGTILRVYIEYWHLSHAAMYLAANNNSLRY